MLLNAFSRPKSPKHFFFYLRASSPSKPSSCNCVSSLSLNLVSSSLSYIFATTLTIIIIFLYLYLHYFTPFLCAGTNIRSFQACTFVHSGIILFNVSAAVRLYILTLLFFTSSTFIRLSVKKFCDQFFCFCFSFDLQYIFYYFYLVIFISWFQQRVYSFLVCTKISHGFPRLQENDSILILSGLVLRHSSFLFFLQLQIHFLQLPCLNYNWPFLPLSVLSVFITNDRSIFHNLIVRWHLILIWCFMYNLILIFSCFQLL